ncbi:hypothetical protein [Halomonas sp. PR-M31]|uniref:hypothetical protein n=1 Tax=Halomonas sp. PR-M31 TaxID=1471202 RepID=UPI0006522EC5|nr:hypothetical protein [Halomonas sp. PR-M31]
MKGSTLSAALLASLMALSTAAIAQESQEMERKDYSNSGVDSAQDVDPMDNKSQSGKIPQDDLGTNSGIDSGENVDPTPGNGSSEQLKNQDGLAPNSGIDSGENVNPGGNSN